MNRAREQAVRAGLAIVENHRAAKSGLPSVTSLPVRRKIKLDQSRLNILIRSRTSRLPWRGQFAPELIDYLMDTVCADAKFFLDPFCGSGTVLFEAVRRGCTARGSEVNPAAWHLASLANFAGASADKKACVVRSLKKIAGSSSSTSQDLFSEIGAVSARGVIGASSGDRLLTVALAAAILLGMRDGTIFDRGTISRGSRVVLEILNEFIGSKTSAECILEDARSVSLGAESVDAIITSPPYINVFNYHQNYRFAAELLGWRPLEAARSEIGANRKHRMNRFLTVVQYCLDMGQCVDEMARTLRVGAPLIIVLGRTSNVLGASFRNGEIFSRLLSLSNSFGNVHSAYRVFTNRFGEEIFEDILIAYKEHSSKTDASDAREIGMLALMDARATVPERNRRDLDEAISQAGRVQPSPFLKLSVPESFAGLQQGNG